MITEPAQLESISLISKIEKLKKTEIVPTFVLHNKNEKIPLPTKEGYIFISPEEIVRCGVNKKVSFCILKCNTQQEIALSLKQTEELLKNYGFLRVHHAHLVNINHVKKYVKDKNTGGMITLSSGEILSVSKRKKTNFINYLKKR